MLNHSYHENTLVDKVHDVMAEPGSEKAIIFCRSWEEAESMGKRLQIPFCHRHMTKEEIDVVLKQLRTGQV
jgi:superfamily II DNA or RNA helicase